MCLPHQEGQNLVSGDDRKPLLAWRRHWKKVYNKLGSIFYPALASKIHVFSQFTASRDGRPWPCHFSENLMPVVEECSIFRAPSLVLNGYPLLEFTCAFS